MSGMPSTRTRCTTPQMALAYATALERSVILCSDRGRGSEAPSEAADTVYKGRNAYCLSARVGFGGIACQRIEFFGMQKRLLQCYVSPCTTKRAGRFGPKRSCPAGGPHKNKPPTVLDKTNGRCHICGGIIEGNEWHADHVLAHSTGGKHSEENYLPAHSLCNNYRWHYDPEEFQWILKIGVWMRTQIERGSTIGQEASRRFCENERRRDGRRKRQPSN